MKEYSNTKEGSGQHPEKQEIQWVRSRRKTIAIQVKEDGSVVVRMPWRASRRQAEAFLQEKREWVERQQRRMELRRSRQPLLTEEERKRGRALARKIIPQRTAWYAGKMGVTYNRIFLREQKTRWGSCSGQGNLNFNWKLILLPQELMDYVIVHELAHRREMNHSEQFWKIVEEVLPDYRERRKRLREEG